MEIELDAGIVGVVPRELRVCEDFTYGSIVRELCRRRDGHVIESASYRVAKDGAFIHRSVQARTLAFFFRQLDGDADVPYAIRVQLPNRMATSS